MLYFMFLLSISAKDFTFVSTEACFWDDISTSATLGGNQAAFAHCKVFSGCFWERLLTKKIPDEWIPQMHLGLGLKRLTFHY